MTKSRNWTDLVAISGDLTQRARTREFRSARRFLDAIPFPQIVVPGNHDVPLHNLFSRFLHKLDRYRCFISTDLEPFHCDSEMAVLGVNTARSFTWKNGRINRQQLEKVRARFANLPIKKVKIEVGTLLIQCRAPNAAIPKSIKNTSEKVLVKFAR